MGALSLLPPGKGALCSTACEHEPCRLVREIAAKPCMLCGKELGFGVAVYCYPSRTGHADAIDGAHERALLKFVEGLADLAADLYLKGKLPTLPEEKADRTPPRRKRRGKAAPPSTPAGGPHYLLPEFDLQFTIPSGRGKQKPSMKLEQHHHLLWPGKPEGVGELK